MKQGRTFPKSIAVAMTVVGGVMLATFSARAAEDRAATNGASAATAGDSISAAKREFESMKAARNAGQQQKGALPRLSMPELHAGQGDAQPFSSTKKTEPENTGKKSGNWLVDAMEKSARDELRRERGERELLPGEKDDREIEETRFGLGERDVGGTASDKHSAAAENDAQEPGSKRPVVNPLTRYLAGWMTPQDYAVLKPGLEQSTSGPSAAETQSIASLGLLPTSADRSGIDQLFSGPAGLPIGSATQAPRENPYLQVFQPPANFGPSASSIGPALAPPPGSPPPPSISPLTPLALPEPQKSRIPEFAKPAQDEKYFKQLKRF